MVNTDKEYTVIRVRGSTGSNELSQKWARQITRGP